MAFLKYANAVVEDANVGVQKWEKVLHKSNKTSSVFNKTSSVSLKDYSPDKYLLTHCTIIASVDVDDVPNVKVGEQVISEDGEAVHRPYQDYHITPETSKYVNQNADAWERDLLLGTFESFIGAENYVEHIQIPELSKGKVIDAVARDLDDTVYIDILVATNRKHEELVADIEAGKVNTLSMGCSIQYSICTKCGNVAADETDLCAHVKYQKGNHFHDSKGNKRVIAELCFPGDSRVVRGDGTRSPISEIETGDEVLTHKGVSKPVVETFERDYKGDLVTLDVMGHPESFRSTPNHPYLVLQTKDKCACGCGKELSGVKTGAKHEYTQKYKQGHNLNNPQDINVVQNVEFDFERAGDVEEGDILALPIPQRTFEPEDLNLNRAELLGWFLAEGSYSKDLKGNYTGIQFTLNANDELDVAKRLAELLGNEFDPEVSGNKKTQAQTLDILSGGCKQCPRSVANNLGISRNAAYQALKKLRNKGFVESRKATREDKENLPIKDLRTLVWERSESNVDIDHYHSTPRIHKYDRINEEDGQKLVVCYTNRQAAGFMLKHAGEYSDQKRLSEKAIYWPEELQEQLLKSYVHGDGTVDKQRRHHVTSTSVDLIDQMQLIAARCGIWTRRQVIWNGKSCYSHIGREGQRGDDNFLPSHQLSFQRSDKTDQFFEMVSDQDEITSTPAWGQEEGYFLYKVKSTSRRPYEGKVYNLSVNNINSYLVEGLAVHNCGHKTDLESVTFIEASWVANPAFKGAVLRTVLNNSSEISEEERASNVENQVNMMQASPMLAEFLENQNISKHVRTAAEKVFDEELESFRSLKNEMRQVLSSMNKTDEYPEPVTMNKGAFMGDDDDDDEEEEEDLSTIEEVRQLIKEQLGSDIKQELVRELEEELGLGPEEKVFDGDVTKPNNNDNLIKAYQSFTSRYSSELNNRDRLRSVFSVVYEAKERGWSKVSSLDGVTNRDIVAAMYIKDRDFLKNPLSTDIYSCLSKVGGSSNYSNVSAFINACSLAMGRRPTDEEKKVLIKRSHFLK